MLTRGDRVLICVLAIGAALAWPLAATAGGPGERVVISAPGGETVAPLGEDAELVVAGALGEVVVRIEDGRVRVTESGCPDQTCVNSRALGSPSGVIACVPNRVIVRVEGGEDDGLDARIR